MFGAGQPQPHLELACENDRGQGAGEVRKDNGYGGNWRFPKGFLLPTLYFKRMTFR
jgi:hypothetical protein